MNRSLVFALAVCAPVVACDGFKEAMTAHVDVAARAGSQELSVTRLGDLLGASKVPLRRDVVKTVADMFRRNGARVDFAGFVDNGPNSQAAVVRGTKIA